MGDRSPFRPAHLIPALLALALFFGGAATGHAGHDLGQVCYTCHNIRGGQVWPGSYSVWSGLPIGMSPYSRPITCEVCHTDYGDRFKATSESHHPVSVINLNAMSSDYDNGVVIRCKDCHNADSVTNPILNLNPDLAPLNYNNIAGNGPTDGYPNHDVASPDNLVNPGNPPHLLSMLLSGGQRTVSGSGVYTRAPSSVPATDYAYCLSCHDGSANTARQVNVRQDYIDKGHYFKLTNAGQGITAGDRIPCSDCHASHNSGTNARLFEPDNTTFSGTRPLNLRFASPYAPTNAEYRAMCIFCHNDTAPSGAGYIAGPYVRGVEPSVRPSGITGHAPTDTQSCKQCHNPHKTPGGGPDCLTCHTTGGAAGAAYAYIDALFKGVGSDNGVAAPANVPPLSWSQHGGFTAGSMANFVYVSPYTTAGTNDCMKCHGDRHNNTGKLIDADPSDGYVFDNATTSLRAATQAMANAFCLTCHDGGNQASTRIGNQTPPNVAATWATRGHGLASGTYTVSGNAAAGIKCIDCHEIHGSNHAKLLPADNTATGNFAMPAGKPGMTFRNGTLLASALDFTNHSLPSSGDTYGTTGNPGGLISPAQGYTGPTPTTGFCDACHRFAGTPPAGTVSTTNQTHTHEGIAGQGNPAAQMTFTKDCTECHNTHGGANANVYMIQDNITVTQAAISGTFPVVFTDNTRFDPVGTGNALCNVCHASAAQDAALNVSHNYRTTTVSPDHAEGTNCTVCHAHGKTDNTATFGFPQAGCNTCHGPLSDSAGMPSQTDGATYDVDANNLIGTRGGTDNTAHYIHVNYLVNRRGIARASTCYVCHVGGGSTEAGGHPGNPTNKTYKSLPTPTAVPYLQVALDNTGAVLNVWNGAETGPRYSGTPGQAADGTNGWKTCSNTNCHYALSPSWSGRRQIANYLGVTDGSNRTYPPLSAYGRVGDNVVVNQFRMQTTPGTGATTATSIALAGTNVSGMSVRVYRDNGDNTFVAATDNLVGTAVSFAADNTATISGLTEPVNQTGANYWIVLTLSGAPADGAALNARVTSVTTPLAGGSQVTTTNASPGTVVDTGLPASTIATSGYLTSSDPVTISGGASDARSGVNHVDVSIRNGATGNYWNCTNGFTLAAQTWCQATGTTSWSYSFSAGIDNTMVLSSRATDNVANVQSPATSGSVILDRVHPTVTTAIANTDNTHVLVTFSEAVDNTTASAAANYTITGGAGLTVSAAVRQADNVSVLLTTSVQSSGVTYTVTVDNSVTTGVQDLAGNNMGTPRAANFTGYAANVLSVTDGVNDPTGTLYLRRGGSGTGRIVTQQFRLATATGTASVTQIVVTRAGNAPVSTNGAHLYRDTGSTPGSLDGTDVQIGGTGINFTGNTATFPVSETGNTTGTNYLVVLDIDNTTMIDGQTVTTQVTGVTASIGVSNTSTVSRTLSVDITAPTSAITTTSPYTTGTGPTDNVVIAGTAADGGTGPSGVNHVDVSVQRTADSLWLQAAAGGWGASQVWITATYNGIDNWALTFVPGGDNTYNILSRSTDNANDNTFTPGNGNVQSPVTTLSGFVTDRVHPTVVSATAATDNTHVTVVFSEQVDATTSQVAGNYVITGGAGLTVSAAARQADNVTVILTTSQQTAATSYTVTVSNVTGRNGNLIGTPNSATFTGYGLAFASHAYFAFLPTAATSVGVDGNAGGWTSGNATGYATPQNSYIATSSRTPVPGGWGTAVNYRTTTTLSGTGVLIHRFYIMDNLATANTIQAQTVTGQATIRAGSTADTYWLQLCEYDPAGVAGNCTQIGNNSSVMTGFPTATPQVSQNWTLNIPSDYTIQPGHRLQLRLFMTTTITNAQKRSYFGGTTAGNTATSFTISETTTQNLAPPRMTGDTTAIACNSCHQFAPSDATAGFSADNQYYYARRGSHTAHGIALIGGTDPANTAALDTCTVCHPAATSTYGFDHASGAVNMRSGSIGTRTAGPAYADDGTFDNATRTCSNVYCHAGRPTPQAAGQSWGYGSTAVCGACHAVTPPYGKHAIHNNGNIATTPSNGSTAGAYDYSCYYCHPSGTAHVNYPASLPASDNQAAQVSFSGTLGSRTVSGTYAGAAASAGRDNSAQGLSWTNGSCGTTVYCHTNGQGGAPIVTPTWNQAGFPTGTCAGCHDNGSHTYAAPTQLSTSHRLHTATDRYQLNCRLCHNLTVTGADNAVANRSYHVNGVADARIDNTVRSSGGGGGGSYVSGTGCGTNYCHSNGQAAPTYNPIAWGTTATCTSCHETGGPTTTLSTRHQKHTDNTAVTGYNFTCDECHALTMSDNSRTALNATTGYANHVDGVPTVSFSATLRSTTVPIGGSYAQGVDNCANSYCHSDGTSLKNSGTIQANSVLWTTAGPLLCNACHGVGGPASGSPNYATSGTRRNSHAAHLAFGCQVCHARTTTAGTSIDNAAAHVNGAYDVQGSGVGAGFAYAYDNALGSTCAFTSGCHGTATVRWGTQLSNGCFTCHAGVEQIYKPQNDYGTPGTANPVDNTQYLSRGHGRPQASGAYAATNNPAAHMDNVSGSPSDCYYCHSQNAGHIPTDNVNDPFRIGYGADTTGQKGSAALRGAYADSVNSLCLKCHGSATDRSGVAEAATVAVNMQTHANGITGTTYASWPVTPWKCIDCHDPHGDANNAMIRSGINAPNSGADTSAGSDIKGRPLRTGADVHAIAFTDNSGYAPASYAIPGAGSWGICEVCHTRTAAYAATGAGTDNAGTHASRTGNCVACHSHAQGFKGACNICHSYPGQDNTATNLQQMTRGHWDHVGQPGAGGEANGRGFACELCHFNYLPGHNQSGYVPGQLWTAPTYYANVSIRFDNTWNPGAVTYNGQPAGTVATIGIGGTGVCAGLYCHGNNAALNANWFGSAQTPRWDNVGGAPCGACHDTGTSDTTAATRMRTGNHPAHIDNIFGPGIGAFSGGGNCSEGAGCHTAYGLSPTTAHVNNQVNLRLSPTDNTPTNLAGTQVCRNCHSTYASTAGTGDTLVRTQANWDNAAYKVPCITCHNASAGQQGTQNLGGTGHPAPNVEAAWAGNGHGAPSIDNASTTTDSGAVDQVPPVRCETCHDEAGLHIGTAKDLTNPWRLDNALTGYTQTGGLDRYCLLQCHTQTAVPPRHAWRVNGSALAPAQTKDNTIHTHPTVMQLVPQPGAPASETVDMSRWFQVTADTAMPVAADLLSKSPAARSTGSLLVCVTCHDPHGVGTAAIATRTFSGANDNGFQMLRYKSGTLRLLCTKCHM